MRFLTLFTRIQYEKCFRRCKYVRDGPASTAENANSAKFVFLHRIGILSAFDASNALTEGARTSLDAANGL